MVNEYYVRRIDKNRNMCNNLMNNQNIMFVIYLPYEKTRKIEIKNKYVLMNDENIFLMWTFLHREYYLFSQNSESSLEQ